MKYLYTFLIFIYQQSLFGQSFIGFLDNYSGINSVVYNPASILNTSYNFHFNLGSVGLNLGSNNKEFDLNFLLKFDNFYQNLSTLILHPNSNKKTFIYSNIDVLGPSFLWVIDNYNAIGITTRSRNFTNIYDFNSKPFIDLSKDVQQIDGHFHSNLWSEYGLSYAGLFRDDSYTKIKLGTSIKILQGHFASTFKFNDIETTVRHQNHVVTAYGLNGILLEPIIDVDGSYLLEKSDDNFNIGFGLDVGIEYEIKNRQLKQFEKDSKGNLYYKKSPYLLKIGISLLDLGYIKYNTTVTESTLKKSFSKDDYPYNFNEIIDLIENKDSKSERTFILPTTLSLNTDYNFNNKFYINTNIVLSLIDNYNIYHSKYVSNFVISPRYETQHFSAFLPIYMNAFGTYKAGFGLKSNYIFIGSSSIISSLIHKSQELDFYIGIQIPIFNKPVIKEYLGSFKL